MIDTTIALVSATETEYPLTGWNHWEEFDMGQTGKTWASMQKEWKGKHQK